MSERTVPVLTVIRWLLHPLTGGEAWTRPFGEPSRCGRILGVDGCELTFWEDEPPTQDSPGELYGVEELVMRGPIPDPIDYPVGGEARDVALAYLRPLHGLRVTPDGSLSHWVTLRFIPLTIGGLILRLRWDDGTEASVRLMDLEFIIPPYGQQDAA